MFSSVIARAFPLLFAAVVLASCGGSGATKTEYLDRGNAFRAQKKYAEAIVEYGHAVREDTRYGEARLQLARALAAAGDQAAALREIVRAADLLPETANAQLEAANALIRSGERDDALARIEKVLSR